MGRQVSAYAFYILIWTFNKVGTLLVRVVPLRILPSIATFFRESEESMWRYHKKLWYKNEINRARRRAGEIARFHRIGRIDFHTSDIASAAASALEREGYSVKKLPGDCDLMVEAIK